MSAIFKKESETVEEKIKKIRPDEFMIRPCIHYDDEYLDCASGRGRFHQYFVYGEFLDCNQWVTDYENCNKWKNEGDEQAYEDLIASEKVRRYARLRPHYQNTVWKKRDKPPENWNAPLPEWMQKQNENSYLEVKAQSIREGHTKDESKLCVIQ